MAAVVGDLLMTLLLSTLEGVECTLDTYPGVNGISPETTFFLCLF